MKNVPIMYIHTTICYMHQNYEFVHTLFKREAYFFCLIKLLFSKVRGDKQHCFSFVGSNLLIDIF